MRDLEPIRAVFRQACLYNHAADDLLCERLAEAMAPKPAAVGGDLHAAIAAARSALARFDAAEPRTVEQECEAYDCAATVRDLLAALDAAQPVAWPAGALNRDETLRVLSEHNAWRRGASGEQTDPRILGLALDAVIAHLSAPAAPPAAVPSREDLLGAIGRGWTHATTKHMPVDVTLAVAIEKEVRTMLAAANKENNNG